MNAQVRRFRETLDGLVLTPTLMWLASVPFGVGCLLWLFVVRGR